MIIDMRTYTHKPNRYRRFLEMYKDTGFALTSQYLGKNIGLFTTSSGTVNRTVQWFAYEDHEHRDRCRRDFLSSAGKQSFTNGDEGADGCIRTQMSQLIVPTCFSPLRVIEPELSLVRDPKCPKRIFEFNTYFCLPGHLQQALDIVEKGLFPAAREHDCNVLAYLTGDAGPERIHELRAFTSLQARMDANSDMRTSEEYIFSYSELCRHLRDTDSVIWDAMPMSIIQ